MPLGLFLLNLLKHDIFQVFDIDVENLPMFVYQLPPGTSDVLLTDRVIFTVTNQEQVDEVSQICFRTAVLSISTDGRRKASAISLRKVGYFLP